MAKDIPVEVVDLRESVYLSYGVTCSAVRNPVRDLVEVFVDAGTSENDPAIANLRLTPDAARELAEALIAAIHQPSA